MTIKELQKDSEKYLDKDIDLKSLETVTKKKSYTKYIVIIKNININVGVVI